MSARAEGQTWRRGDKETWRVRLRRLRIVCMAGTLNQVSGVGSQFINHHRDTEFTEENAKRRVRIEHLRPFLSVFSVSLWFNSCATMQTAVLRSARKASGAGRVW